MTTFTPEQLAARRNSIGASEAAAALGLSPWKTPYQLWREKMGMDESEPENEAMYWGSVLEGVILQRYMKDHDISAMVTQESFSHPEFSWMTCTLDGSLFGRVIEAKTARSAEGWGEPGSADVPQPYLIQTQYQMLVTGYPVADVPVLIGGSDYREYTVPEDKELQELILDGTSRFWNDYVLTKIAPDATTLPDVKLKYGHKSVALPMEADARLIAFYEELAANSAAIKELEAKSDAAKLEIMKALGERDTLMIGGKVALTWKAAKPPLKFDAKAFEAAHPDIYKQFQKLGEPSRRLLLKDIK